MAMKLGLTESGYFKVEKGKTKLDFERLLLILMVLEITVADFFKDIDQVYFKTKHFLKTKTQN